MWKTRAALIGGIFLLCGHGWAEADQQTPTAEAFVAAAKTSLCAELGRLDGGALTQSLSKAAGTALRLRIVLDPSERSTRMQGRALTQAFQAMTPGAEPALELRWAAGAGWPQRRLLADDLRLLRWSPGTVPLRDDSSAAAFQHRFESHWAQALTSLPEALALEDDLKALPDPRDKDPHLSRRKDPSAGSGQAQDIEGNP